MPPRFFYVYLLVSQSDPSRHYVGLTNDFQPRLARHNSGQMLHTVKFRPWQIDTAIAFSSRAKAVSFERYLKSHSGRAFAQKHF